MAKSLELFGVPFTLSDDAIDIIGLNQPTFSQNSGKLFEDAEIDSFGDHRVAMACAIGALRSIGSCRIRNCSNVATSFPSFLEISNQLGLSIRKV